MALKPDRYEEYVFTDFFMNETAEAGSVVVFVTTTTGVGAALDDVNAKVKKSSVANASGELIAGILAGPVVDKDLSQTHLNPYNRETQLGGKVGFIRNGSFVVSNMIAVGVSPKAGDPAFATASGLYTTTSTNASTRIGTFSSGKDADGYAKLIVNIA